MLEDWERITALEFKNTYAHIWRTEYGEWVCKFTDWDSKIQLKVDSLRDALDKASKMFIEAKYKQSKKAPRIKKIKPTGKKAKKNVNTRKASKKTVRK